MTKKKLPKERRTPNVKVNEEVREEDLSAFLKGLISDSGLTQQQAADMSGYKLRAVQLVLSNSDYTPTCLHILRSLGYDVDLVVKISTPEGDKDE